MTKINLSKNTKIVCTIGPASESKEMLIQLIESGMNVCRINFSHGTYEEHLRKIKVVREFEKEGIYIPIMLDTRGPEIRCFDIENKTTIVQRNSIVRITTKEILGNNELFGVNYKGFYDDVTIGSHVKIDDGKLDLLVIDKDKTKKEIICKALVTHELKSKKGVNLVGSRNSMPFISEKDKEDLIFGCKNNVDYISASFVRNAQDIRDIRKILVDNGQPDIMIISKIENVLALENIDEIIEESDGIMVARGDLGVEIPPEDVPIVQDELIKKCRIKGKPVITATQMLDSMTHNLVPTRAEVSDVATAVVESSDCIMLSGESASGEYPNESVQMQARISARMEKELNFEQLARDAYETSEKNNNDAIANSIANTAKLINAQLIVNFTETGKSTRRISKARPCCPILSISNNKKTVYQNALYWGVHSVYIPTNMPDFIEEMEAVALYYARKIGFKPGDQILISGGTPSKAGKMNFLRIVQIPEIKMIL